ncbi:hypothetical protein [Candidatus Electronema sp. PJ]|uniref:hypothetical protein n=1 Tax=Candidatus Electronema sp. PJ TaxID=3401572 RepID=UPI003AA9D7EB
MAKEEFCRLAKEFKSAEKESCRVGKEFGLTEKEFCRLQLLSYRAKLLCNR